MKQSKAQTSQSSFSRGLRFAAWVLIASCLTQEITSAQGSAAPMPLAPQATAPISVPRELGRLRGFHQGSDDLLVVNIQDAHASLSAQKNIASILESLFQNYDMRMVGLEGSAGVVDTRAVSSYPVQEARRVVAESLLADTKISGGEFFKIISSQPAELYGVEDEALYTENIEAYKALLAESGSARVQLDQLWSEAVQAEHAAYSPEHFSFVGSFRRYRAGEIEAEAFWKALNEGARAADLDWKAHSELLVWKKIQELEKEIDFKQAESEREAVLLLLNKQIKKEERRAWLDRLQAFRAGKIGMADFYTDLLKRADPLEMPQADRSMLVKYVGYLQQVETLDTLALTQSLESASAEIEERLAGLDGSTALSLRVRALEIIRKFFDASLAPSDDRFFAEHADLFDLARLSSYWKTSADSAVLIQAFQKARVFYEVVHKRNEVMIENLTQRMREKGVRVAALVSGGFHSEGLSGLMAKRRVSHVVVMPTFEADKTQRPYVAVITDRGSYLDKALRERAVFESVALLFGVEILAGKQIEDVRKRYLESLGASEALVGDSGAPTEKHLDSTSAASAERAASVSSNTVATGSIFVASGADGSRLAEFAQNIQLVRKMGSRLTLLTGKPLGRAYDVARATSSKPAQITESTLSAIQIEGYLGSGARLAASPEADSSADEAVLQFATMSESELRDILAADSFFSGSKAKTLAVLKVHQYVNRLNGDFNLNPRGLTVAIQRTPSAGYTGLAGAQKLAELILKTVKTTPKSVLPKRAEIVPSVAAATQDREAEIGAEAVHAREAEELESLAGEARALGASEPAIEGALKLEGRERVYLLRSLIEARRQAQAQNRPVDSPLVRRAIALGLDPGVARQLEEDVLRARMMKLEEGHRTAQAKTAEQTSAHEKFLAEAALRERKFQELRTSLANKGLDEKETRAILFLSAKNNLGVISNYLHSAREENIRKYEQWRKEHGGSLPGSRDGILKIDSATIYLFMNALRSRRENHASSNFSSFADIVDAFIGKKQDPRVKTKAIYMANQLRLVLRELPSENEKSEGARLATSAVTPRLQLLDGQPPTLDHVKEIQRLTAIVAIEGALGHPALPERLGLRKILDRLMNELLLTLKAMPEDDHASRGDALDKFDAYQESIYRPIGILRDQQAVLARSELDDFVESSAQAWEAARQGLRNQYEGLMADFGEIPVARLVIDDHFRLLESVFDFRSDYLHSRAPQVSQREDLLETARQTVELLKENFSKRESTTSIHLEYAGSEAFWKQIAYDPLSVTKIMAELVNNAERNGAQHIVIQLSRNHQEWVLEVSDDGPGIPAYLLVDGLLWNYGKTGNAERGGTGLGLNEIYNIIHNLGGSITVQNGKAGRSGAAFSVTLPIQELHASRVISHHAGDFFTSTPVNRSSIFPLPGRSVDVYFTVSAKPYTPAMKHQVRAQIYYELKSRMGAWSHADMVVTNDYGDGSYRFGLALPASFEGEFVARYSVDGGKTWHFTNSGPGDHIRVVRSGARLAEVVPGVLQGVSDNVEMFNPIELLSPVSAWGVNAPESVKAEIFQGLLAAVRSWKKSELWTGDVFWPRGVELDEALHDNGFYKSNFFSEFMNSLLVLSGEAGGLKATTLRKLVEMGDEAVILENVREFVELLTKQYSSQDLQIKGITPGLWETLRNVGIKKAPLLIFEYVIEQISETLYTLAGMAGGAVLGYASPSFFGKIAGTFWGDFLSLPDSPVSFVSWDMATAFAGALAGYFISKGLQHYADQLEVWAEKAAEGFLLKRLWESVEHLDSKALLSRRAAVQRTFSEMRPLFHPANKKFLRELEKLLLTFSEDEDWVEQTLLATQLMADQPIGRNLLLMAVSIWAEIEDSNPGYLEQYFSEHPKHPLEAVYRTVEQLIKIQSENHFFLDKASRAARKTASQFRGSKEERELKYQHELRTLLEAASSDYLKDAEFYQGLYDKLIELPIDGRRDVVVTLWARIRALDEQLKRSSNQEETRWKEAILNDIREAAKFFNRVHEKPVQFGFRTQEQRDALDLFVFDFSNSLDASRAGARLAATQSLVAVIVDPVERAARVGWLENEIQRLETEWNRLDEAFSAGAHGAFQSRENISTRIRDLSTELAFIKTRLVGARLADLKTPVKTEKMNGFVTAASMVVIAPILLVVFLIIQFKLGPPIARLFDFLSKSFTFKGRGNYQIFEVASYHGLEIGFDSKTNSLDVHYAGHSSAGPRHSVKILPESLDLAVKALQGAMKLVQAEPGNPPGRYDFKNIQHAMDVALEPYTAGARLATMTVLSLRDPALSAAAQAHAPPSKGLTQVWDAYYSFIKNGGKPEAPKIQPTSFVSRVLHSHHWLAAIGLSIIPLAGLVLFAGLPLTLSVVLPAAFVSVLAVRFTVVEMWKAKSIVGLWNGAKEAAHLVVHIFDFALKYVRGWGSAYFMPTASYAWNWLRGNQNAQNGFAYFLRNYLAQKGFVVSQEESELTVSFGGLLYRALPVKATLDFIFSRGLLQVMSFAAFHAFASVAALPMLPLILMAAVPAVLSGALAVKSYRSIGNSADSSVRTRLIASIAVSVVFAGAAAYLGHAFWNGTSLDLVNMGTTVHTDAFAFLPQLDIQLTMGALAPKAMTAFFMALWGTADVLFSKRKSVGNFFTLFGYEFMKIDFWGRIISSMAMGTLFGASIEYEIHTLQHAAELSHNPLAIGLVHIFEGNRQEQERNQALALAGRENEITLTSRAIAGGALGVMDPLKHVADGLFESSSPAATRTLRGPVVEKLLLKAPVSPDAVEEPVLTEPTLPGNREKVRKLVGDVAVQHGLDPKLVGKIAQQESGFNPKARSSRGALGVMQLMPATARELGVGNPLDPRENTEGGVRYLKGLIRRFGGNMPLAVAAYNAGSGRVERTAYELELFDTDRKVLASDWADADAGRILENLPRETRQFVVAVLPSSGPKNWQAQMLTRDGSAASIAGESKKYEGVAAKVPPSLTLQVARSQEAPLDSPAEMDKLFQILEEAEQKSQASVTEVSVVSDSFVFLGGAVSLDRSFKVLDNRNTSADPKVKAIVDVASIAEKTQDAKAKKTILQKLTRILSHHQPNSGTSPKGEVQARQTPGSPLGFTYVTSAAEVFNLGRYGFSALRSLTNEESGVVRLSAAWAIQKMENELEGKVFEGDRRDAVEALTNAAKTDPDDAVRAMALLTLEGFRDVGPRLLKGRDPRFDAFRKGLEDKNERVRFFAARAVATMQDPRIEPVLAKSVNEEKDLRVVAAAARSIGRAKLGGVVQALTDRLQSLPPAKTPEEVYRNEILKMALAEGLAPFKDSDRVASYFQAAAVRARQSGSADTQRAYRENVLPIQEAFTDSSKFSLTPENLDVLFQSGKAAEKRTIIQNLGRDGSGLRATSLLLHLSQDRDEIVRLAALTALDQDQFEASIKVYGREEMPANPTLDSLAKSISNVDITADEMARSASVLARMSGMGDVDALINVLAVNQWGRPGTSVSEDYRLRVRASLSSAIARVASVSDLSRADVIQKIEAKIGPMSQVNMQAVSANLLPLLIKLDPGATERLGLKASPLTVSQLALTREGAVLRARGYFDTALDAARTNAANADLAGSQNVQTLIEVLRVSRDPGRSLVAVEALGVLEDATAQSALENLVSNSNREDSRVVALALSELADRYARGESISLPRGNAVVDSMNAIARSQEANWQMRVLAIRALGASGDPSANSVLSGALSNKDPLIRLAAAEAIARTRAEQRGVFVDELLQALIPQEQAVATTAALNQASEFRRAVVEGLRQIYQTSPAQLEASLAPFIEVQRANPANTQLTNTYILPLQRELDPQARSQGLARLFGAASNPTSVAANTPNDPYMVRVQALAPRFPEITGLNTSLELLSVISQRNTLPVEKITLAIYRLGEMGGPGATDLLMDLARNNPDVNLRVAAVRALVRLSRAPGWVWLPQNDPTIQAISAPLSERNSGNEAMKIEVIQVLSNISDPQALNAISKVLSTGKENSDKLVPSEEANPDVIESATVALRSFDPGMTAGIATDALLDAYVRFSWQSKNLNSDNEQRAIRATLAETLVKIARHSQKDKDAILEKMNTRIRNIDTTPPDLLDYMPKDRLNLELRPMIERARVNEALPPGKTRAAFIPGRGAFENVIAQNASSSGVDAHLVHALIQAESDYNPAARSSKGAEGLMQLTPQTAKRFGVRNPLNAQENIVGGTKYLAFLMKRYSQNMELALAAYNTGEGNVDAALRRAALLPNNQDPSEVDLAHVRFGRISRNLASETQNYVPKVLAYYNRPQPMRAQTALYQPERSAPNALFQTVQLQSEVVSPQSAPADPVAVLRYEENQTDLVRAAQVVQPTHAGAVYELERKLDHGSYEVRVAVAKALGRFGAESLNERDYQTEARILSRMAARIMNKETSAPERIGLVEALAGFKDSSAPGYLVQAVDFLQNDTDAYGAQYDEYIRLSRALYGSLVTHGKASEIEINNRLTSEMGSTMGLSNVPYALIAAAYRLAEQDTDYAVLLDNLINGKQRVWSPTRDQSSQKMDFGAGVFSTVERGRLNDLAKNDRLSQKIDLKSIAQTLTGVEMPQNETAVSFLLNQAIRREVAGGNKSNPTRLADLLRALAQTESPSRTNAGEFKDPFMPVLKKIAATEKNNILVRANLADALASSKDPEAVEILRQLLKDSNDYVVVRAIRASSRSPFAVSLFNDLLSMGLNPKTDRGVAENRFVHTGRVAWNWGYRFFDRGPVLEAMERSVLQISTENPQEKLNFVSLVSSARSQADDSERYWVYGPILRKLNAYSGSEFLDDVAQYLTAWALITPIFLIASIFVFRRAIGRAFPSLVRLFSGFLRNTAGKADELLPRAEIAREADAPEPLSAWHIHGAEMNGTPFDTVEDEEPAVSAPPRRRRLLDRFRKTDGARLASMERSSLELLNSIQELKVRVDSPDTSALLASVNSQLSETRLQEIGQILDYLLDAFELPSALTHPEQTMLTADFQRWIAGSLLPAKRYYVELERARQVVLEALGKLVTDSEQLTNSQGAYRKWMLEQLLRTIELHQGYMNEILSIILQVGNYQMSRYPLKNRLVLNAFSMQAFSEKALVNFARHIGRALNLWDILVDKKGAFAQSDLAQLGHAYLREAKPAAKRLELLLSGADDFEGVKFANESIERVAQNLRLYFGVMDSSWRGRREEWTKVLPMIVLGVDSLITLLTALLSPLVFITDLGKKILLGVGASIVIHWNSMLKGFYEQEKIYQQEFTQWTKRIKSYSQAAGSFPMAIDYQEHSRRRLASVAEQAFQAMLQSQAYDAVLVMVNPNQAQQVVKEAKKMLAAQSGTMIAVVTYPEGIDPLRKTLLDRVLTARAMNEEKKGALTRNGELTIAGLMDNLQIHQVANSGTSILRQPNAGQESLGLSSARVLVVRPSEASDVLPAIVQGLLAFPVSGSGTRGQGAYVEVEVNGESRLMVAPQASPVTNESLPAVEFWVTSSPAQAAYRSLVVAGPGRTVEQLVTRLGRSVAGSPAGFYGALSKALQRAKVPALNIPLADPAQDTVLEVTGVRRGSLQPNIWAIALQVYFYLDKYEKEYPGSFGQVIDAMNQHDLDILKVIYTAMSQLQLGGPQDLEKYLKLTADSITRGFASSEATSLERAARLVDETIQSGPRRGTDQLKVVGTEDQDAAAVFAAEKLFGRIAAIIEQLTADGKNLPALNYTQAEPLPLSSTSHFSGLIVDRVRSIQPVRITSTGAGARLAQQAWRSNESGLFSAVRAGQGAYMPDGEHFELDPRTVRSLEIFETRGADTLDASGKRKKTSLFPLLARHMSSFGAARLKYILTHPYLSAEMLQERYQTIEEIADNLPLRKVLASYSKQRMNHLFENLESASAMHFKGLDLFKKWRHVAWVAVLGSVALSLVAPQYLMYSFGVSVVSLIGWFSYPFFGQKQKQALRDWQEVSRYLDQLIPSLREARSPILKQVLTVFEEARQKVTLLQKPTLTAIMVAYQGHSEEIEKVLSAFADLEVLRIQANFAALPGHYLRYIYDAEAYGLNDIALKKLSKPGEREGYPDAFPALASSDKMGPIISLSGVHHPSIPLRVSVSNNIVLGPGQNVMMITGNVMGGKSVSIQATLRALHFAQTGFLPRVSEKGTITPMEFQALLSLEDETPDTETGKGLSSFAVEWTQLKEMIWLAKSGRPVMFFLDEVGKTSPLRVPIVKALIRMLAQMPNVLIMMATHDIELTNLTDSLPNVRNFHVEDRQPSSSNGHDRAAYQLIEGPASSSNALAFLESIGLPSDFMTAIRDEVARAEQGRGREQHAVSAGARLAGESQNEFIKYVQDVASDPERWPIILLGALIGGAVFSPAADIFFKGDTVLLPHLLPPALHVPAGILLGGLVSIWFDYVTHESGNGARLSNWANVTLLQESTVEPLASRLRVSKQQPGARLAIATAPTLALKAVPGIIERKLLVVYPVPAKSISSLRQEKIAEVRRTLERVASFSIHQPVELVVAIPETSSPQLPRLRAALKGVRIETGEFSNVAQRLAQPDSTDVMMLGQLLEEGAEVVVRESDIARALANYAVQTRDVYAQELSTALKDVPVERQIEFLSQGLGSLAPVTLAVMVALEEQNVPASEALLAPSAAVQPTANTIKHLALSFSLVANNSDAKTTSEFMKAQVSLLTEQTHSKSAPLQTFWLVRERELTSFVQMQSSGVVHPNDPYVLVGKGRMTPAEIFKAAQSQNVLGSVEVLADFGVAGQEGDDLHTSTTSTSPVILVERGADNPGFILLRAYEAILARGDGTALPPQVSMADGYLRYRPTPFNIAELLRAVRGARLAVDAAA